MAKAVLIDLGGVVYQGERLLPGARAALDRLRRAGTPLRFLTNTTRQPASAILAKVHGFGLAADAHEVITPVTLARQRLRERELRPHLLVHPAVRDAFADLDGRRGTAVVVGDVGTTLDYAGLNAAFRALLDADDFVALAKNRAFRDADGGLSLDAGATVAALEYAARREATVVGKPAPAFFRLAVADLGCDPADAAMIGDDAEADVAGAIAAGLQGVLVRQGKYRPGDEAAVEPTPTAVADDLADAVDGVLAAG
jgi:HAD superfamily hydrolase (TIGR01458 family)